VYCRIPVCFVVQSSSGTGRADGPMDFAVRDEPAWIRSREKALLNPAVGAFVATNTRKCCDLSAHGERSAWLAAKETLKRNPASRVRWLALQELALRVPTAARGADAFLTGPPRSPRTRSLSTNSRSRGSSGTCAVRPGGPRALGSVRSGPSQRLQCRRIWLVGSCQLSVVSCCWLSSYADWYAKRNRLSGFGFPENVS
jgi:hypothetical protein